VCTACGGDSGGGGGGSNPGPGLEPPAAPVDVYYEKVECLENHDSWGIIKVRVRWGDSADNEDGYDVEVTFEGGSDYILREMPADSDRAFVEITLGDAGPTYCSFYVTAWNEAGESDTVSGGRLDWYPEAFNFCQ